MKNLTSRTTVSFSKDLFILISLIALMIAIIPAVSKVYQLRLQFVEIKAQLTGTTRVQLFYDRGTGFNEGRYSTADIPGNPGFQTLRFEIPPIAIKSLLLRPVGMQSTINIESVKIISNSNVMPLNIPSAAIKPLSQIESPESLLASVNIKITPNIMKSIFIIKPATPLYLKPGYNIIILSTLKVLLGYFLSAFVILSVIIILCKICINYIEKRTAIRWTLASFCASRKATILICIVIFCTIFGTKLWMINSFSSSLPKGDQWHGELLSVYKPYFEGTLDLPSLFSPYNEHRIFFSRILSLSLLLINGQWDAKLQMYVNAIIFAVIGCGLFLFYVKSMLGRYQIVIALSIALILALPFGWENTLLGFQSSFYFLIGFSIATIWLLEHHSPWTIKWGLGCFLGIGCLFTMASGLLAPLAVLGTLLIRAVRSRNEWKNFLKSKQATIAICVFIIIAGVFLMPTVEEHRSLQAHSAAEFFSAFAMFLAWPNLIVSWWSIFNWLPFAAFLVAYILRSTKDDRAARFTIGLGLLVLLQAGATAFARGAVDSLPPSRYMDIWSFGMLANICCLIILWTESEKIYLLKIKRIILVIMLLIWLPINIAGLSLASNLAIFWYMPRFEAANEPQRLNVEAFLATGNIEHLKNKPRNDVPHHNPDNLASVLQEPVVRKILRQHFPDHH